jgi:hypothetical protein
MLVEGNKDHSKVILKSSTIKLIKVDGFVVSSLNFKHIIITNCNVSKSNQRLLDWFKTQVVMARDKESIIIFKICQVRKGGTLPFILTIFSLI